MEKINVLIVDDHEFVIDGICNFIDSLDQYAVAGIAMNGAHALEVAEQENIDILITDIDMPVMDGIELTKRIRKLNPAIKIMALAAKDEHFAFDKVKEVGIQVIVSKEANCSEMENALEALNDNMPYISADVKEHIVH